MLSRVTRAWRTLAPEGRLAAGAALLLFITMFLPWYQLNAVVAERAGGKLVGRNLTAFGVFSFVEAAVLLVAIAVLVLLFARAEGRSFHLPGGDGTIVTIAGGWVALLLIWRLFDKPDVSGAGVGNVGIQWGIFFALGAAGLLTWSGLRMRAAHRPEPVAGGDEQGSAAAAAPSAAERAARRARARTAPGTERTRPLPAEQPPHPVAPPPQPAPPADEAPTQPRRRARPPLPSDETTRALPHPPVWEEPEEDPPTERLPPPTTAIRRPAACAPPRSRSGCGTTRVNRPQSSSSSRRSTAQRLSSWRLESCSLRSTAETCASTVLVEIPSLSATSL